MSAIDYDAFLAKLKGYQPDTPAVASEKNREDGTTLRRPASPRPERFSQRRNTVLKMSAAMPKPANLSFEAGFTSWSRTMSNAPDKIAALRVCAEEAVTFIQKGCEKQEAVDELTQRAEAVGRLDFDTIQRVISEVFERAERAQVKGEAGRFEANGKVFDLSGPLLGKAEKAAPPKLNFLNPTAWAGQPVPRRRWLVPNWIPLGVPSILSGDGAAGKTTIALQLSVATVRGTDWLGAVIDEKGPVIFLTAEEDCDEIHRRLDAIAAHHGIGFEELANLHLLCMPGEDFVLGAADKNDMVRLTPLFGLLEVAACDIRPSLIVIEAAADVFAVNENNRSQVRQSVGLLRRLGNTAGPAVLLIQHPSLSGLQSNTGTSGSTQWNNAARSRMYFASPVEGDDEGNVRELRVMKANYGPKGEKVRLRWQRGVFVPEGSASTPERLAEEARVDELFLRCLEIRTVQGLILGAQPGRNYAPAEFAKMPEANGLKRTALAMSMERLLSTGRIRVDPFGPKSRGAKRLVRVNL